LNLIDAMQTGCAKMILPVDVARGDAAFDKEQMG
jgi:hypothetical protein